MTRPFGGGDRADSVLVLSPPQAAQPDADATLQALVDRELARIFRAAVGLRLVFTPFVVMVALTVAWVDPSPWRRGLMVAVASVGMIAALVTELRARSRGIDLAAIPINLVAMAVLQILMIVGTGGLVSPLLPVMVPIAFVGALSLGRRPGTAVLLGTQLLSLSVLALGQGMGWLPGLVLPALGGAGPSPLAVSCAALVMALVLVAVGLIGMHLRGRIEHLVRDALLANRVQLQTWVAWSRELELLGGEIAHELKNPLASIKGLGALVARDLLPGRAADRMAVLQGEVDRMQGILDEFLTFSRPLTPLSTSAVQPAALCRRAVELHEGLARAAGVGLRVTGRAPDIEADPHKLLQVLTNLLQNALAVAPPGSSIDLDLRPDQGGVRLTVGDRGPGVPAAIADRVFEAGISTRAEGGGLGLTIALGIARQHGGRLALEPRPGGGTLAVLWLPLRQADPAAAGSPDARQAASTNPSTQPGASA